MSVLITLLAIGAIVIIVLLCLAGMIISCMALSGTWLITVAAALAALHPGEKMPRCLAQLSHVYI